MPIPLAPLVTSPLASAVTYTATTVTDTNQQFTPNSLIGRTVTVPSGSTLVVTANTATVITGSGGWTSGTPANGTQYRIEGTVQDHYPLHLTLDNVVLGPGPISYEYIENLLGHRSGAGVNSPWGTAPVRPTRQAYTVGAQVGTFARRDNWWAALRQDENTAAL